MVADEPDFKHKPEGAPSSGPVGTGSSKSQITNQMQMSLDEAHLILNSKKEDALEVIEKVRRVYGRGPLLLSWQTSP